VQRAQAVDLGSESASACATRNKSVQRREKACSPLYSCGGDMRFQGKLVSEAIVDAGEGYANGM
jgi:hypothetical protein